MGTHGFADIVSAMPDTTLVVACAVGALLLVIGLLMLRSRGKAAPPPEPQVEPPRELAKRTPKEPKPEPTPPSQAPASIGEDVPISSAPLSAPAAFPQPEPTLAKATDDAAPAPSSGGDAPAIEVSTSPPPAVETPSAPLSEPPVSSGRAGLRSYSSIQDETVAESGPPASLPELVARADARPQSESRIPPVPNEGPKLTPPPPPPRIPSEAAGEEA